MDITCWKPWWPIVLITQCISERFLFLLQCNLSAFFFFYNAIYFLFFIICETIPKCDHLPWNQTEVTFCVFWMCKILKTATPAWYWNKDCSKRITEVVAIWSSKALWQPFWVNSPERFWIILPIFLTKRVFRVSQTSRVLSWCTTCLGSVEVQIHYSAKRVISHYISIFKPIY